MRSTPPTFFAAYGSLRRWSLARREHAVVQGLQFYGQGLLRGLGFMQNGYPGVVEQPGIVAVEIYQVLDGIIWKYLDRYEGYDPAHAAHALFYRKEVKLLRPAIRASVYFLGREITRGTKWQQHVDAALPRAFRFEQGGIHRKGTKETEIRNFGLDSDGQSVRRRDALSTSAQTSPTTVGRKLTEHKKICVFRHGAESDSH